MSKRARRTLADVGEFGFLARLLPTLPVGRDVILGPGDDCAIVQAGAERLLLTVDALVEGVHFRAGWLTPRQLGRKAFLVNASDIAAMGGAPRWCVVNLAAPRHTPVANLAAISRGVAEAARENGASLVGGNLSRGARLAVDVTLVGAAPRRPLRRSGARPGDLLYVTGQLGEAALGLRALQHDRRARGPAVQRFRQPPSRWRAGVWLAHSGAATAMIDISDGLAQDLGHLCAASRIGARIVLDRLPCSPRVRRRGLSLALGGGEDYELLCAVPAPHRRRVERLAARFGFPFTGIGECRPAREGLRAVAAQGRAVALTGAGFDHFARRAR
jgi:thiamine-monophosphate kinase